MNSNEERYIRQIPLIGEDGQERLRQATVLIAGVGGLGSPVAMYLAVAGVGNLILVDGDVVEPSNLNRQVLHSDEDIGRLKVLSAEEKIQVLNPEVEMIAVEEMITSENAVRIGSDAQIIVDALDNFSGRFVLDTLSRKRGVPLVHGAVSGFHGQATTFVPGQTACMRCLYGSAPPQESTPVMGVTAGVIGLIQATEVIKYLTGKGDLLCNRLLIWDGLRSQTEELAISRDPACPACGEHTGE
jgi:molybdopterin/thiamine biosynthesis adenylyltransferase